MAKKLPFQVDIILFYISDSTIEYLLLKRQKERGGFWQPITGGLEEGESLLYAARREVWEETGILKVKNSYDMKYSFSFMAKDKVITEHVFAFEVYDKKIVIEEREHSNFGWFEFDDAVKLLKWDTNISSLTKLNKYLIKSHSKM